MSRAERTVTASRPRDRKNQLALIAADLFRRRGYHSVGVEEIAAAAGISGPAVYRHFRSKQAILGHLVLTGVDQMVAGADEALEHLQSRSPRDRQRVLLAALTRVTLERRDLGTLWRREGRNLPPEDWEELTRRLTRPARVGVELERELRPELSEADAQFLCWAAISVLGSISDHHVTLPKLRFEQLLQELAATVLDSTAVPAGPADTDPPPPVNGFMLFDSRREQLLTEAIRLFRQRGFHGVTMEEIGAAAGISGPSIYHHFTGKADILLAACERMAERLRQVTSRALSSDGDAETNLLALARTYVDVALENRDLVAVYRSEGGHLPAREATEMRRVQKAYLQEWSHRVAAINPDSDEKERLIRVHAAYTVVNDIARMARFDNRPALRTELVGLVRDLLIPAKR